MELSATSLPEVKLLKPKAFGDPRGFFLETYREDAYQRAGLGELRVVQVNHSRSRQGTLRGLHYQEPRPQGKLVWVPRGRVLDVAVDIRRGSPRFGRWTAHELSDENHHQLWIPPGFAHGFIVLSEFADFVYGCTDYFAAEYDRGIRWDDPTIGVEWPIADPIISRKDAQAPLLEEVEVLPEYPRT